MKSRVSRVVALVLLAALGIDAKDNENQVRGEQLDVHSVTAAVSSLTDDTNKSHIRHVGETNGVMFAVVRTRNHPSIDDARERTLYEVVARSLLLRDQRVQSQCVDRLCSELNRPSINDWMDDTTLNTSMRTALAWGVVLPDSRQTTTVRGDAITVVVITNRHKLVDALYPRFRAAFCVVVVLESMSRFRDSVKVAAHDLSDWLRQWAKSESP